MLRDEFRAVAGTYCKDVTLSQRLWQEVEANYADAGRHYHTLTHLDKLLAELMRHRTNFKNWDAVVFAIAYHDFIYNVSATDNEAQSAVAATERLRSLGVPEELTASCHQLILATKAHEATGDHDVNLFVDADLSILGAEPQVYRQYTQQIRNEYSIYQDMVYKPGRRKVLQHFLAMPYIYKTAPFRERYESRARLNLKAELESLQKNPLQTYFPWLFGK